MNSTVTVLVFLNSFFCSSLNPKSKLFLCITTSLSGPQNRKLSQHWELGYPAPAHVFSFRRPQLNSCHFNVHNSLMEAHLALDRQVQCQPLDWVYHMLESYFLLCGASILMTLTTENEILWAGVLLRVRMKTLRARGSRRAQNELWTNNRGGKWPASSALNKASEQTQVVCSPSMSCVFNVA